MSTTQCIQHLQSYEVGEDVLGGPGDQTTENIWFFDTKSKVQEACGHKNGRSDVNYSSQGAFHSQTSSCSGWKLKITQTNNTICSVNEITAALLSLYVFFLWLKVKDLKESELYEEANELRSLR